MRCRVLTMLFLPLIVMPTTHAQTITPIATTPLPSPLVTTPPPSPPLGMSTLVVSILTPILAVGAVAVSTGLACFTHFNKKRKIRKRQLEARARQRAWQMNNPSDQGNTNDDTTNTTSNASDQGNTSIGPNN